MILLFLVYDLSVQKLNRAVITNAARSNAIVSSIFPGNIRDRLIGSNRDTSLFTEGALTTQAGDGKPLADLFLESTVIFADIVVSTRLFLHNF